jgi:hypothetical protein
MIASRLASSLALALVLPALAAAQQPDDGLDREWSYKVSAGYFVQDALPRPTGTIPNAFNTPYPPYASTGTSQAKFDARVDHDVDDRRRLTFAGGVAGTRGIIHSGIGPFDITGGSRLSYVSTRYEHGGRRLTFFANILDGDATNLLATVLKVNNLANRAVQQHVFGDIHRRQVVGEVRVQF